LPLVFLKGSLQICCWFGGMWNKFDLIFQP